MYSTNESVSYGRWTFNTCGINNTNDYSGYTYMNCTPLCTSYSNIAMVECALSADCTNPTVHFHNHYPDNVDLRHYEMWIMAVPN